jgi:hypothetical protein
MKRITLPFLFLLLLGVVVPQWVSADGMPNEARPHYRRARPIVKEEVMAVSQEPKVRVVSWDPDQKVEKFLGELTECVTTQWDVLKLLSGPNIINVEYPTEKEQWGYSWLWSYDLKNPIGNTIISMNEPGKRILRGKNPVELFLVFNENDVLEKISMTLVEKSSAGYGSHNW